MKGDMDVKTDALCILCIFWVIIGPEILNKLTHMYQINDVWNLEFDCDNAWDLSFDPLSLDLYPSNN